MDAGNQCQTPSNKFLLPETFLATAATIIIVTILSYAETTSKWNWLLIPAIFVVFPVIIWSIRREFLQTFGLTFEGWQRSLLELALFSAATLPLFFLGAYLVIKYNIHGAGDAVYGNHFTARQYASTALYQFFYIAISEEIFFRGYLQTRLHQLFHNKMLMGKAFLSLAALVTALIFTCAHLIIEPGIMSALVVIPGILFGLLRDRTKSLLAPVLYHGLCNTCMFGLYAFTN